MLDFLKSRWFLFLVLVVFVALKIPCLHYAYFWDESWPYAVAVKAMYNHGISLMPNAIDAEISRGHPLLFHALAAGWMHLFGSSYTAVHCFPLVISVLMLISIYEAGLKLFNQRVAMMALLMAAIQVTFYVQATFLLFEVMVALLVFVSLYFYARDKYVLTALCLTALFYTKESGLMAGFVLGMDALIGLFKKGVVRRVAVSRFLSVAVPCVLIVGYFIVQRYVRGWFLFPFYGNLIVNKWSLFIYNFRAGPISAEFLKDKRYFYFIIVMAVAVIAGVKNKKPGYAAYFRPGDIYLLSCGTRMHGGQYLISLVFCIASPVGIVSAVCAQQVRALPGFATEKVYNSIDDLYFLLPVLFGNEFFPHEVSAGFHFSLTCSFVRCCLIFFCNDLTVYCFTSFCPACWPRDCMPFT